jgi:hypothetical protein
MDPTSESNALGSALEQRLLEAARSDHIPQALCARMAEGLGVQAAGASLSVGGTLTAPLFAKSGLWGALAVAGVVTFAALQLTRPDAESADGAQTHEVRSPPSAQTVATSALANAAPASAPDPRPTERAPEPLAPPSPAPAAPAVRAAARPSAPATTSDDALRAEVTLLDRARLALRDGESARALRLLDQHQSRFTQPTLAPEAAALRIEALVRHGAVAQADALGQRFAAAYPTHPLRARVEALRGSGSRPASGTQD